MKDLRFEVLGIGFQHRRPEDPLSVQEYADFMAFVARLAQAGVHQHVRAVAFDTKWMGFHIDCHEPVLQREREVIRACAGQSLNQFSLLGEYGHRDQEPGEQDDPGDTGECPL